MKFEWTVNIGNLLTAVGLLVGFVLAHLQNIRKLQDIETKVGILFDWFKGQITKG